MSHSHRGGEGGEGGEGGKGGEEGELINWRKSMQCFTVLLHYQTPEQSYMSVLRKQ